MPSTSTDSASWDASTLCFIGGGNMACSLIGGLRDRGMPGHRIKVAEPGADARKALERDFGISAYASNEDAAADSDIWVLAVKPQVARQVCESLAPLARVRRPVLVSIAAGITSAQLERWLGGNVAVVRAMPNTPALLGAGVTGLFANDRVDASQRELAVALLGAVGPTVWIGEEAQMDAVTAVSGSGPAYVFLLAEAMQAAGVAQGLPPDTARTLVNQTLLGAATMLTQLGEPADVLRTRVTSPGGTTQAAVETFEAGGFGALVDRAIAAATVRGRELSAGND